jgi:peptidoglycan/LPS O-acetylase OafA/YrhL
VNAGSAPRPPFWQYASKATAAAAAAVVVAAPVLISALADGHLTTAEIVACVAAAAGVIATPAIVYAAPRNRPGPVVSKDGAWSYDPRQGWVKPE